MPASFAETDLPTLHDFIEQHSFALVISQGAAEPVASHLPLLLERQASGLGRLRGHFAKANTHWQCAADQPALAIFHGPHAYISPSWLTEPNFVPTWNYVAVHAYGTLRRVDDRGELLEILHQSVARYESKSARPWSIDVAEPDFIDRLLANIVGFEIELQRLEGKWKLSQNHSAQRQAEIAQGLIGTARPDELAIAELMNPGGGL